MKKSFSILLTLLTVIALNLSISCNNDDDDGSTEEMDHLSLSTNEIVFNASETSDTFTITSDTSWSVSSSEEWLIPSPASGSGNDTVVLFVKENVDLDDRVGTVTITDAAGGTEIIDVTQGGTVQVSSSAITVDNEAGSEGSFTITTQHDWTIINPEEWVEVEPTSGSGDATINVTTTTKSTITNIRRSILVIIADGAEYEVDINQTGLPCVDENEAPCENCSSFGMPDITALPVNDFLPDPFQFYDGTEVTTLADWECRKEEIAAMAQEYEYGYKPCTPYSATTGSFADDVITVTVQEGERKISFDCPVFYPDGGSAPYPAMIGIGFSNLNNDLLSELGVAIIAFPNGDVAAQNGSRGRGKFYDFFCRDYSAGALMGWAWGVSRLIDALEQLPESMIDPTRLGITGCSRNGKGALTVGAFDERIVLTVPQESGSGGSTSWRVSDYMFDNGQGTQTLRSVASENVWFRESFSAFYEASNQLPYDHHMIQGMIAPRGLLIIENDILWLGPESSWNCANAAQTIYSALGVPDNIGYSGSGPHTHCQYIDDQLPELEAFIRKFMLNEDVQTGIIHTELDFPFDEDRWVNWDVPTLQ